MTSYSSPRPAVLVTGGATRIGAALSRGFARDGWHVVIHYRNSGEAAEALAVSLPSAETIACDLRDEDSSVAMIESLAQRLPDWRCLINSASVFRYDDAQQISADIGREAFVVNALTPARMIAAFLAQTQTKALRTAIQITDMKLANPNPDFFSYTLSKYAAGALPDLFAQAHDSDTRIYGLAPGAVLASHDQAEVETEISHRLNLLERRTMPDEIVDAALFLASGNLRSGAHLFVDSGQHLLSQDRDVIWLARDIEGGPMQ
ncbi:MAG: SDR family oxidoreductase [Erythrobacter sp.]